MDDPLLGLAMWETQEEVSRSKRNQRSGSASSKSSKNPSEPIDGKLLPPPPPSSPPPSSTDNRREEKEREEPKMRSNNSSECFPCLSALDREVELKLRQTKEIGRAKGEEHTDSNNEKEVPPLSSQSPEPLLENYWLLRLFESNLFTMHIAVQYLFRERDPNVQKYLGKKLTV